MTKIFLAKTKIKPLDIDANRQKADAEIKKAVARGAKIIAFPVGFLTGTDLGILADKDYFAEIYNETVLKLSAENKGIVILADCRDTDFAARFYLNGELLDLGDSDGLEIDGCRIRAYDLAEMMALDTYTMCENGFELPDCMILTESAPVVAGQRALLKKLLEKIHRSTGATVIANLGGRGFTSHPYVYMPCAAVIDEDIDIFTRTEKEYFESENIYEITTGVNGTGEYEWRDGGELEFTVDYNKSPLIPTDVDEMEYCLDLFGLQTKALADRLSNIGCKSAVVAVSGGLDSALALLVTVNAFDSLGLDRRGIHPFSMPGFGTSSTTKNLGRQLIESLGFEFKTIDIKKACAQALADIGHDGVTPDVTFENVQARMRTVNGLNMANALGGLFIGTGDLSEEALGFATYGGDRLASYNVNSSVSKTVIRTMLPYVVGLSNLSAAAERINGILDIPVSPELVPHGGEILQKTEEILAPYKLIDFYIYCFAVAGISPSEMTTKAKEVFGEEFTDEYLKEKAEMFCKKFISGRFKRSCSPEGAITTHARLIGADKNIPSDSSMGFFAKALNR